MHDFGWIIPVAIVGIIAFRQTMNTWIRARHGYPLTRSRRGSRYGDEPGLSDQRTIGLLTDENSRLTGQVSRLEDRIAVLERIATDGRHEKALAAEIESLRDH